MVIDRVGVGLSRRCTTAIVLVFGLLAAACGTSSGVGGDSETADGPSAPRGALLDTSSGASGGGSGGGGSSATAVSGDATDDVAAQASRRSGDAGDCASGNVVAPSGPSAQASTHEVDGVTVELALYPRPDYAGNPWTDWGQGIVLDDGRFISGIGDHLGEDGNSFVFVYDPSTRQLTRVADVLSAVGHRPGEWGQGKLHSQMVQVSCGQVLMASYWGTRDASYPGGHILSLDTDSYELESLGIPLPGHGIPSLSAAGDLLYGEAVDVSAGSGDDSGVFFVYDPSTREVVYSEAHPEQDHSRVVLVGSDGTAMVATSDNRVLTYEPGGQLRLAGEPLPEGWLRAATPPASDGTVYGVTNSPPDLFARDPSGAVRLLAQLDYYTTSVALAGDSRLLYMPGAHGDAWRHGGALYSFDTTTEQESVIVELGSLVETQLGLTVGGSYSVAVDGASSRAYVVMNAGPSTDTPWGEVVLAVVSL